LKLVFAARNRMSAVLAAKTTNSTESAPNAIWAAMATTDGPPSSVGRRPNVTANTVSPMNRMPRSTAIADIVLLAFRASGGLNAGTPLAMASTPVSATEPPANALSRRRMVTASVPNGTASWRGGIGTTVPSTMRTTPMATMARARPTNR
jgi:hypothetical protein